MKPLLPILLFLSALLGGSTACKTKGKSATGSNDSLRFEHIGFGDGVPAREGTISAQAATEEEIFVQGCIEKSIGNDRRAIVNFLQCLEMNPNNAAANYELAGLYRKNAQPEKALSHAKAAADLAPANRWYKFRYAELLQENGRHDEATTIFRELSAREPENVDLLFRYASCLVKAGKPADALKTYDRIETLEGLSDTLAECRILAYRAQNDKAGEEKVLTSMLAAFPRNMENYTRLAEFYAANAQAEKAAEIYRKMTVEFPYLVAPYLALATHYQSAGQHDKAFAAAARGFENHDELSKKIALLYEWYPVADNSPALTPAARKEADSLSRILCRVHPDKAEPFIAAGDYLYKEGKIREARDQYHKATSIAQEQYGPWKRLLEINDKLNDAATQEKDSKTAIELFPTQPDPYYYLGMIKLSKKEYKNAITYLESARDFNYDQSRDLQLKKSLIDAYRKTDDHATADKYTEDVLAKDSSDVRLIAAYCASLAERRTQLFKAEQLMLGVVAKEPNNASYLELLAWIEYGMNDYKAAKPWMEKALEKDPGNARINERMGDILFRLGDVPGAVTYWKKAKEKGGTGPALERKISSQNMQENE